MLGLLVGSLILMIEAMNCERPRSAEVMATKKSVNHARTDTELL